MTNGSWAKALAIGVLAVAALGAIVGCYKVEVSFELNERGLISDTAVTLKTSHLEVYNLIKARLLEGLKEYELSEEDLEELGVQFQEDPAQSYSISASVPLDLIISSLEGRASIAVEIGEETITLRMVVDFAFIEEVEQEFGPDEVSRLLRLYGEPSFALIITMPGEIIEHSHGEISKDGDTLIWIGKVLDLRGRGREELLVKSKLPPGRRPRREPRP